MKGKCNRRDQLRHAQAAVFRFIKGRGHSPFTYRQIYPYIARAMGNVPDHQVKTDVKWYVDNLWLERIESGRYRVRLDRDMSRLKYRNQCSKKFLTR